MVYIEICLIHSISFVETSLDGKSGKCDMCLNYETQLVGEQKRVAELTKQLGLMERCQDDLQREMASRKDMEQKWSENKEEHKAQVSTVFCFFFFLIFLFSKQIVILYFLCVCM